jgi:hypothetical protein
MGWIQLPLAIVGKWKKRSLENPIELEICYWLRAQGFFFWKTTASGYYDAAKKRFRKQVSPFVRNGVSDILLVSNGQLVCLEVKSEKGVQSEAQIAFEKDVKRAGARYFVVRSVSDVKKCLEGENSCFNIS